MAQDNAKKFIDMMLNDEEQRNRFANMTTEEGLKAAKEMGLDFTTEELKEAGESYEMTPEEMEMVSGGEGIDVGKMIKYEVAGMGSGAAASCLIGCIGGPVGAAIGTCVGGIIGSLTGGFLSK